MSGVGQRVSVGENRRRGYVCCQDIMNGGSWFSMTAYSFRVYVSVCLFGTVCCERAGFASFCLSVCYNMKKRETALRGRREWGMRWSDLRAVIACVGLASLSLISVWRLIRWHCLRCISTHMRISRHYQHATKEFCDTPWARNVITHRKRKTACTEQATISCLKV